LSAITPHIAPLPNNRSRTNTRINTGLTILRTLLTNAQHCGRQFRYVHHRIARSLLQLESGDAGANAFSMKQLHRILLTLSLTSAAVLSAQTTTPDGSTGSRRGGPGGPGGHGGPRRGGNPIIRVIDADKNGEVSSTELANAPAAIRTLDANGDGIVSADELRPMRPANAPTPPANAPARPADASRPADGTHPRPVDPVMLALDANSDGSLSAAEIANAASSLAALDLNKDGKLTPDELRPLPPTN
jgi:hypothetical protein